MATRKNVSLPDRYEEYYEMLKENGVFREEFGGFSQFVQAMVESLAEDKPRILHDHIQTKEEKWKAKRKQLEEEFDIEMGQDLDDDKIEEQKYDFFDNMLDTVQRMKKSDEELVETYERLEGPWMKKYRKKFHHVNKKSFRNELESVLQSKEVDIRVSS